MPYLPYGYVIDAVPGSTWLYEYQTYSECSRLFKGEPANFKRWHPPVSVKLRAKLAVWAFTMMDAARRKPEPEERVLAMQRADNTGRFLAMELRAEIGSGPVIVYIDQFHEAGAGPQHWQITDTCRVNRYWHTPSAGYVIHHDELAAWGWEYRPAGAHLIGGNVGDGDAWMGEHRMQRPLVLAFSRWQERWHEAVRALSYDLGDVFDWDAHNAQGLALAHRLKQSLDGAHRVIYLRPTAEPDERKSWCAAELRMDGSHTPYIHAPYWAEPFASSQSKGPT